MKRNNFLLFVAVAALLASCTITNRRYMPGYSVSWVNNAKSPQDRSENVTGSSSHVQSSIVSLAKSSNCLFSNGDAKKSFAQNQSIKVKIDCLTAGAQKNETKNIIQNSDKGENQMFPIDTGQVKKKNLPEVQRAKTSLTFGVLSLAIPYATLFIVSAVFSSLGWLLIIYGFYALLAGIIFSIIGIKNGVQAIRRIRKEPSKYSGMGDAIVGLALSASFYIIIALLIVFGA